MAAGPDLPAVAEPAAWQQIGALQAQLQEVQRENRALREHRDLVVSQYLAVRASTSWRLGWTATAPLRLAKQAARNRSGRGR